MGLSLLWTEARKRGVGMERVVQWVCERPAKQVRLNESKGSLKVGWDADIAIFDPELHFTVRLFLSPFHRRITADPFLPQTGRQVRAALQEPILSLRRPDPHRRRHSYLPSRRAHLLSRHGFQGTGTNRSSLALDRILQQERWLQQRYNKRGMTARGDNMRENEEQAKTGSAGEGRRGPSKRDQSLG